MAKICPPYINKEVQVCEKELKKAQKAELKAKKAYEFAVEYKKICEERLKEAEANDSEA